MISVLRLDCSCISPTLAVNSRIHNKQLMAIPIYWFHNYHFPPLLLNSWQFTTRHSPSVQGKSHHAMTHNFISQLSTAHLISLSQFLMAHLSQRHGPCMDDKFHATIKHKFYITWWWLVGWMMRWSPQNPLVSCPNLLPTPEFHTDWIDSPFCTNASYLYTLGLFF